MVQTDPQFWEDYREQLLQFILRRVSDAQTAEDIVQDVLLRVFDKLDTLEDRHKFNAWLYRIARNSIIDYYRRQRPTDELPENLADPDEDDTLAVDELSCCIQPFIDQLPALYQEAVQLSEIDGLTQQQVAEKTGLSLPGAKSRVQRGRKLLKHLILQCCTMHINHRGEILDVEAAEGCGGCGG